MKIRENSAHQCELLRFLLLGSEAFVCLARAGGPSGDPEVCGAMTSGGTESILTAVKASRDYMKATRGIRRPEMIIGVSAHAAFYKASEYFNIKLVRVSKSQDFLSRPRTGSISSHSMRHFYQSHKLFTQFARSQRRPSSSSCLHPLCFIIIPFGCEK